MITIDTTAPLYLTLDAVLSRDECRAFIEQISRQGFAEAPVTTSKGPVMMRDVRNNDRIMFDDPGTAAMLYERVRHALPPRISGMVPVGANERLRCYRYRPGQRFTLHRDGYFERDADERSQLTLLVYLDEGCEGGETAFPTLHVTIKPRTGMALLFQHGLLHEGCEVRAGEKHVLRTDVMYRRERAADVP